MLYVLDASGKLRSALDDDVRPGNTAQPGSKAIPLELSSEDLSHGVRSLYREPLRMCVGTRLSMLISPDGCMPTRAQFNSFPGLSKQHLSCWRSVYYLVEIVARYPQAQTIHLVLDNLNTHGRKSLVKRYGERLGGLLWGRFTIHSHPSTEVGSIRPRSK